MRLFRTPRRRGGIYFAVLSVSILVGVIGVAALATARAQRLEAVVTIDTLKCRLLAQSATELGISYLNSDNNWRTNRANGAWLTDIPLGDGALTIEGYDPVDSSLSNRTSDSVVIRGTGRRGNARQSMEVTLAAAGTPIDALKMAIHTAGQLHVNSGVTLTVNGAPASTNTRFRNDGTVVGDAECRSVDSMGTVTGSFNPLAPVKPMPDAGLLAMYRNLGTPISPGSTISNAAIGPGYTPWGPTNPEGVYVINLSSDLTISNSRLVGTLVIISNGKKVTIQNSVNMAPYRTDYPVIITDADLAIDLSSSDLTEPGRANFNPPGVPWNPSGPQAQGTTNVGLSESYPSGIWGLVHTRGKLELGQSTYVKGVLIAESSASSDAVLINNPVTIEYDPSLYAKPPMGYTKSIKMNIVPGSWKQVVY